MSDSTYAALMVSTGNSVIVTKNCGVTESMLDGLDSATQNLVAALEAYAAQCDSEVLTMALESDGDAASSSSVISAYKTGDPKTAISNVNDSLSTAKSENKKGNVKKAIIITLGVIAAMLAIVTIAGRVKTGKWQFPHQLFKQWLDLRKKGKELKAKTDPTPAEADSLIKETEALVVKTAEPAKTAVSVKEDGAPQQYSQKKTADDLSSSDKTKLAALKKAVAQADTKSNTAMKKRNELRQQAREAGADTPNGKRLMAEAASFEDQADKADKEYDTAAAALKNFAKSMGLDTADVFRF